MSTFRPRPDPSLPEAAISTKWIRQFRRQALLVARQHIATKELTIDAIAMLLDQELDIGSRALTAGSRAARPVAPPVRAQIATAAK